MGLKCEAYDLTTKVDGVTRAKHISDKKPNFAMLVSVSLTVFAKKATKQRGCSCFLYLLLTHNPQNCYVNDSHPTLAHRARH